MPINFYIIIVAQLIIFLGVYYHYRKKGDSLIEILTLSAAFGLLLGIPFDTLLGLLGNYTYISSTPITESIPWGLSWSQLALNGLLSFGLAVSTAYFFTPEAHTKENFPSKKFFVTGYVVVLCISFISVFAVDPGILSLFVAGLFIITLGELTLLLLGKQGMLTTLLLTRNYSRSISLWKKIVVIAFAYEIINWLFPFWVWLPGVDYSRFWIEVLIILFGYAVAFHPMITFWQIIKLRK